MFGICFQGIVIFLHRCIMHKYILRKSIPLVCRSDILLRFFFCVGLVGTLKLNGNGFHLTFFPEMFYMYMEIPQSLQREFTTLDNALI